MGPPWQGVRNMKKDNGWVRTGAYPEEWYIPLWIPIVGEFDMDVKVL